MLSVVEASSRLVLFLKRSFDSVNSAQDDKYLNALPFLSKTFFVMLSVAEASFRLVLFKKILRLRKLRSG